MASIINEFTQGIRPFLNSIVLTTTLGSMLVPLVLTLFFFSTPQSRRHPLFILNVMACFCGLCETVLSVTVSMRTILYPLQPISRATFIATLTFFIVASLFSDSILIFRVLAFYPLGMTPNTKLLAIFGLPIVTKFGRLLVVGLYVQQLSHIDLASIFLQTQANWSKNPFILTLSCLQVLDNGYASGLLLYNIHRFKREHDGILIFRSKSVLARLRSLFIIALGNFIFPVIVNIAAIIVIVTSTSFSSVMYVFPINNSISIFGAIFATIWSRRQYWNKHDVVSGGSNEFQLESSRQANRFASNRTRTMVSTIHIATEIEEARDEGEEIDMQNTSTGKKQGNIDSDIKILNSSELFPSKDRQI